jgi:hypothetical protein
MSWLFLFYHKKDFLSCISQKKLEEKWESQNWNKFTGKIGEPKYKYKLSFKLSIELLSISSVPSGQRPKLASLLKEPPAGRIAAARHSSW